MDRSSAEGDRERRLDETSSPPVQSLPDLESSTIERKPETTPDTRLTNSSTRASSAVTSGRSYTEQELVDLIDASDKDVIKTVLLHLCKISASPAFLGALIRGLTYEAKSARTKCRDEKPSLNETASRGHSKSTSHLPQGATNSGHSDRGSKNPFPNVKSEDTASSTPFGTSCKRSEARHVLHDLDDPHRIRSLDPSIRTSRDLSESQDNMETCIHCGKMFTKGSTTADCFYHPGLKRKVRTLTGLLQVQYDCCHGDSSDPPCENGKHVAETKSDFDSLRHPSLPRELQRPRKVMRFG